MKRFRTALLMMALIATSTLGCNGARFVFVRYPDTPVIMSPPSGLSSSELAAIIAAIR